MTLTPISVEQQTRFLSVVETATSTAVGFVVSYFLWLIMAQVFGYNTTHGEATTLTLVFTAASLTRGYGIRRLFERLRK